MPSKTTIFRSKKLKGPEENDLKWDVKDYDASYKVVLAVLRLVGLRLTRNDPPLVKFFWNVFYWFEFLNLFVAMCLELVKMVQTARGGSFQDAVEIFRMMPCVGYLLMAMSKSYKIVYYRLIYENLVSELRGMWPRGAVGREEHDIVTTALRHLRYVVTGYYWCNNFLMVVFLSPPFAEIFKIVALGWDVPLIFPFFYWFPFDPFKRGYYDVILAFQTWHGLITIWFMLSGDLLFCIFMSHITTQFDLLAVRVRRTIRVPVDRQLLKEYPLGTDSENKRNGSLEASLAYEDDRVLQKEISEIIRRHRDLIRLAGDVESLFSFALLVNFFNSSIILCFCGFCCVIVEKINEMVYKSFLITALSQTWLLCWYGQRLLESSEDVSTSVYNSGWYSASKRIKSSLYIMLHRAQKEVHVTTYGFSVISLSSYTTIIKSSWSYFTLLLNIYSRD